MGGESVDCVVSDRRGGNEVNCVSIYIEGNIP